MRAVLLSACDRFIAWCDYLPDERWHRFGRFLPFATANRIRERLLK